jgi:hypothetical protein
MNEREQWNKTKVTKIAAQARIECNRLSEDGRQHYTALAVGMIYHNRGDAGSAVTHRR